MRNGLQRLKSWARRLKRDVVAVWIAARDRRTPPLAKVVAGAVAAYALSPIDLIPDIIPVFGYLDDLLIVPLGLALVVRMIPSPLMEQFRTEAEMRLERPRSVAAAAVVVVLWVAVAAALGVWIWNRLGGGSGQPLL